MHTRVLLPDESSYALASDLLKQGKLVAFPTETVYGLGANALDKDAVLSIFAAKGRPADNPLIVHIHDRSQLSGLCTIPPLAEPLMDAFWPGPLTMLFVRKPAVPPEVTAGLPTVAIRMPSHPVATAMLKICGLPVAAPSANSSGRPSPTTAAHVLEDMDGRIPLILDGGPCDVGVDPAESQRICWNPFSAGKCFWPAAFSGLSAKMKWHSPPACGISIMRRRALSP